MDKNKNVSIIEKCSEINHTWEMGTAETTMQGDNGKMRQINKIMNILIVLIEVIAMLFYKHILPYHTQQS